MQQVYNIPGKLNVQWAADAKAIVDTWESYFVTLDQFRDAVLVKGLDYAKARGGRAWIVDSSKAKGVFANEIQEFIGSTIFPSFAKNGIKYFITVAAQSATTKMTVRTYSAKAGPNGLQLVEADSAEGAIEWLKKNAK